MRRIYTLGATVTAAFLGFGLCGARAQTYGVDYIAFQGIAVILDNPTSAACQANNFNYGSTFTFIYRYAATALSTDSMSFIANGHSDARIFPTAPATSLAGGVAVPITWTYINRHGNYGGGVNAGNSTMTILAGSNAAVSLGTGNIKIVNATIDNFFATAGCTIQNLHGAGVAIPD